MSELFPWTAKVADELCVIRSLHTDAFNHHPGQLFMTCGVPKFGFPSVGSWLNYGLGSESKNLPGYVVLCPDVPTTVGPPLWNSALS